MHQSVLWLLSALISLLGWDGSRCSDVVWGFAPTSGAVLGWQREWGGGYLSAGKELDLYKFRHEPAWSLRSAGRLLFPVFAAPLQPTVLRWAPTCWQAGAVQASHLPVVYIPSDAYLSAAFLSSTVLFFFCV